MPPNPLPSYVYHVIPLLSPLSKELASSKAGPVLLKASRNCPVRLPTWKAMSKSIELRPKRSPKELLILRLHSRSVLAIGQVAWKGLMNRDEREREEDGCDAWEATLLEGRIGLDDLKAIKVARVEIARDNYGRSVLKLVRWNYREDHEGWWDLHRYGNEGCQYRFVQQKEPSWGLMMREFAEGLTWAGFLSWF